MRYISIYTLPAARRTGPPTPEYLEAMNKLIEEGQKAGWLIHTGGVSSDARAMRVKMDQGKLSVTDGPFIETKEVLGGYALLEFATREQAIEHTKRFLEVAGDGECEVYPLSDPPAQG